MIDKKVVDTEQLANFLLETDKRYAAKNAVAQTYTVDKPDTNITGNVVQLGTVILPGGNEVGYYQFFFKTPALPTANSMKEYALTPLLDNYEIADFIDASGVTSNGVVISNGRTDNDNRLIFQQFSKNRKTVAIRTYSDFSTSTALLKIQFLGTPIS